jgi:DNA-directed RNA polymerase alpha subunit
MKDFRGPILGIIKAANALSGNVLNGIEQQELTSMMLDLLHGEIVYRRRMHSMLHSGQKITALLRMSHIEQAAIDKVPLHPRATRALYNAGIHTVGQMMSMAEEDLYKLNGVGRKTCNELLWIQRQLLPAFPVKT